MNPIKRIHDLRYRIRLWWKIRRFRKRSRKIQIEMSMNVERMVAALQGAGVSAKEFSDAIGRALKHNPEIARNSRSAAQNMVAVGRRGAARGRHLRESVSRETTPQQWVPDDPLSMPHHQTIDCGVSGTPDPSRTNPGPRVTECTCGRPFHWLWLVGLNRMWSCRLWDFETGHSRVNESNIDPAYLPETPTRTVNR